MTVGRSGGSRKERVFLIVKLLARKQGSARQLKLQSGHIKVDVCQICVMPQIG